jgi:hypothetical protein
MPQLFFVLYRVPPRLASRRLKTLIGDLNAQYCQVAPPGSMRCVLAVWFPPVVHL